MRHKGTPTVHAKPAPCPARLRALAKMARDLDAIGDTLAYAEGEGRPLSEQGRRNLMGEAAALRGQARAAAAGRPELAALFPGLLGIG